MTDRQRADHIQAKYWNGFVTRTEAQKVFDETAQVVNAQAVALQKMDAVISFIAEKLGITAADIQAWITAKAEKAAETAPSPTPEAPKLVTES